jgi:Protein of unknown function (DUF3662)/FHA domain
VGVLQRFERRLEGLVSGAFAKAFKAEVQPVEIASALQRELDGNAAILARGRTMVPNEFVVELGERDFQRLAGYSDPLASELGDMVREHADEQHYSFVGPVKVLFEQRDDLDTGMFRVRSEAVAGVTQAPPAYGRPGRTPVLAYLEIHGVRQPIGKPRTVLGRGSDVDLRIDDPGISRRHAEIRLRGDGATIHDLGSTNGTYVDGTRIEQAPLLEGTEVRIGRTTLVYRRDGG